MSITLGRAGTRPGKTWLVKAIPLPWPGKSLRPSKARLRPCSLQQGYEFMRELRKIGGKSAQKRSSQTLDILDIGVNDMETHGSRSDSGNKLTPNWKPYVGPRYGEFGPKSAKLLIIGNSHYIAHKDMDEYDDITRNEQFTINIVQRFTANRTRSQFFVRVGRVLLQDETISPLKHPVWEEVAFLNFCGRLLEGSGGKGSNRDFAEGWTRVYRNIRDLEPDCILAVGEQTIDQFRRLACIHRLYENEDGREFLKISGNSGEQRARFVGIRHPAARGAYPYNESISLLKGLQSSLADA